MHVHSWKPPSFRHESTRRWAVIALNVFATIALAACGGGGGGGGGQQQQNNTPPTVSAGADQTITLPATVTLTGSATDAQGQTLTYQWSGPSGVTFASATSASTTATFAAAGAYTLTLTANDGSLSGTDSLVVTVQAATNTAPTVSAGADQTITLPNTATLSGSATDAEGNTLTYAWTSNPASGVTFADASAAATTATFSAAGTYTLTLTANDGSTTGTDSLTVTVQAAGGGGAPTVNAGADQTIEMPFAASLNGSATDDGGAALTYSWSATPAGVTFANAAAATTTATFAAAGTYTLTLTANDGTSSGSDALIVTVSAAHYPAADLNEADPNRGWTVLSPADAGMDLARLQEAQAYSAAADTSDTGGQGGSGFISRRGRLVHSWGNIDSKFASQSAAKSIGGITLGLALDDNELTLDTRAIDILPTFGRPPTTNDPAQLATITVRQLATHISGFEKDRRATDGPPAHGHLQFEPGTTWSYSDGGLNWLADTLTEAFGADLNEVLTSRVLTPLGLNQPSGTDDVEWRVNASHPLTTPSGIATRELASGISINTNAMARIGLLFLRKGQWADTRVVSESFVQSVSTPTGITALPINLPADFPNATSNYGLLWWTNRACELTSVPSDAYWAWGQYDSLLVVIPSLDLVIARIGPSHANAAGRVFGDGDWTAEYTVLEPFLAPIVASTGATGQICTP